MRTEAAQKAKWEKHYATVMNKFWERLDMSGGPDACWPWMGKTRRRGYGVVIFKGKALQTHRVALARSMEGHPDMMACHRCDNPPCCNPSHLFWGTAKDNAEDCWAKGRYRGKPRKMDYSEVSRMRAEGASYQQIADVFGVNQATVGKALKRQALLRASAAEGVGE